MLRHLTAVRWFCERNLKTGKSSYRKIEVEIYGYYGIGNRKTGFCCH